MIHAAVLALTFAVLIQVFTIGALGRRIEKLEEDYDFMVGKVISVLKQSREELEKRQDENHEIIDHAQRVIDAADGVIKASREAITKSSELIDMIREEPEVEE